MKPTIKQMFLGRHSTGFLEVREFRKLFPDYVGTVRVLPLSTINCVRPTGWRYDLNHIIGCRALYVFEQPIMNIEDVK